MNAKRALIVIDLQIGLGYELYNFKHVLEKVNQRIAFYRKMNQPIIFIQHSDKSLLRGSTDWNFFPELNYYKDDWLIEKHHANAFYHTPFQTLLSKLAIQELEFSGVQIEYCVDTTLRMAHGLEYKCFVSKNACTTLDNYLLDAKTIIDHTEAIWQYRFAQFLN